MITPDTRRRLLILAAAVFTAWGMWAVRGTETPSSRSGPSRGSVSAGPASSHLAATGGSSIDIPIRVAETAHVRDLFQGPKAAPAPQDPKKAARPSAPPLPFIYLGAFADENQPRIFLGNGQNMVVAKPGTRLEGGWIVESITSAQAVFNYEPLQQRQTLSIGGRW